jgi:hypothetical protein
MRKILRVMIDWARLDSTYGILAFIRQTLGEFVRRFQKRGQQSNRPGGGGGATDDKVFLQVLQNFIGIKEQEILCLNIRKKGF